MLKEFKTIAEQIHILETRGMRIGKEASTILLRENYYSIINGYKTRSSTRKPCSHAPTMSI